MATNESEASLQRQVYDLKKKVDGLKKKVREMEDVLREVFSQLNMKQQYQSRK
jgi:hypothetical protein